MRCADIGDHGKVWFCTTRQAFNFTRPAHSHLHHNSSVVLVYREQGEWHTNVVVVVANTGVDGSKRC